jgi:DNA-binding transcriptional LysR family regulator
MNQRRSAVETALGLELFERDVRRAELTAAGRSLIPDARAVIARTEEMKNRAKSISAEGRWSPCVRRPIR